MSPARLALQALIAAMLFTSTAGALTASALDRALTLASARNQFSGVVRIVEGDRVLFEKAYGLADRRTGAKNTPATSFEVASITKHVTATAIYLLHRQGLLSVHDPIGKHFPNLRRELRDVTLLSLVTHRSGLGYPPDDSFKQMASLGGDGEAYFRFFLENAEILAPPGEKFEYNNLAYSLLSYLVAKVSGESFEDFAANNILSPLQADCDFSRDRVAPARRALGFDGRAATFSAGELVDSWGMRGSTGMVCTAKGLADLELGLLRGQLVDQAALEDLFFLRSFPTARGVDGSGYSFGWFFSADGRLDHSGSVAGFLANLTVDTRRSRITVVLTNDEGSGAHLNLADQFETEAPTTPVKSNLKRKK